MEVEALLDEVKRTREEFIEYANSAIRRLVEENKEYLVKLAKTLKEVMDWPVTVDRMRVYWVDEDFSIRQVVMENCTIYKDYMKTSRILRIMEMRCNTSRRVEFYIVFSDNYIDKTRVSEDTQRTLGTILTLTDKENIKAIVTGILKDIEEIRRKLDEFVKRYHEHVLSMKREVQTLFSRLELMERVLDEG